VEAVLIWGLVLLAVCLILVVVEIFVPSAGLISVVATATGVAGLVCLFKADTAWGLAGTGVMVVLVPTVLAFGFKVMPSTPMGRKLMFGESGRHEPVLPDAQNPYAALVGLEGEAVTDLRPVGVVRIKGEKIDALTEVGYIRAGTPVRVSAVEGMDVKVRPIT
jgi:membrane-bound ClpP family serine protease